MGVWGWGMSPGLLSVHLKEANPGFDAYSRCSNNGSDHLY